MDAGLLTILSKSKIFSSLSSRVIKKLLPKFEKTELFKNQTLYYQGDPSDSIEFILSGKVRSTFTTASGEKKIINELGPGETVGELGTLSGDPRATTIKAVKDTVLLKLPRETFIDLCRQYPRILFDVLNPIITQSHKILQTFSSEKFRKHIAFLPLSDNISLKMFTDKIKETIPSTVNILVLSDYDETEKLLTSDEIEKTILDAKVKSGKKLRQRILYILKNPETPLARFCFSKTDMLYLVGNSHVPPAINPLVSALTQQFTALSQRKPELILLHDDLDTPPLNTTSWLKLTAFALHHHIRTALPADFRRLIRFVRNKAVGIVLGGGGTRGWGHVGAIKALIEAGIPIDIIGGTSVGAIIAASYAHTESSEKMHEQFHDIIEGSRRSVSWLSLTWPAISLFNAKGFTQALQKTFSETRIEDMWLSFFCVSTNLNKLEEDIHHEGILWEKLRCSTSIPGIIPPMVLNGDMHFDGGLLNNLPIDVMRNIITQRGTVIGIELAGVTRDETRYNFPPILTFWQTLLAKLGFGFHYIFPRFIDTFLKSLLVGSSLKSQQNNLATTILVNMDLSKFGMLYFNRVQEKNMIEIGYNATINQIKKTYL